MTPLLTALTALSGFLAVALGALGAHALRGTLEARSMVGAWQTAAHYHLAHSVTAVAILAWAAARPERAPALRRVLVAWLLGNLLFAGSIYGLALGGPRLLGPVTPLGGIAFMVGWALLGWEARRPSRT